MQFQSEESEKYQDNPGKEQCMKKCPLYINLIADDFIFFSFFLKKIF